MPHKKLPKLSDDVTKWHASPATIARRIAKGPTTKKEARNALQRLAGLPPKNLPTCTHEIDYDKGIKVQGFVVGLHPWHPNCFAFLTRDNRLLAVEFNIVRSIKR